MKISLLLAGILCPMVCLGAGQPLTFTGTNGPGLGKHIVLLAGDEEYRSEEAMPMMAKILASRHGFKCTVLFALNPQDGTIDPLCTTNLPGLEALGSADLCFMFLRFRELPDSQMTHLVDYINSGRPLLALRTSTHAFAYERNKQSPYAAWDWRSKDWPGGFGRQVLGETWVAHHGDHGKESTRGIISGSPQDNSGGKSRPQAAAARMLNGVKDIWGPTDVYAVVHLPAEAQVLVWGQVLQGMKPSDPPVDGPKNSPMMPLVWLRDYTAESGRTSKVITSTIGAAVDLESEGLRRLLVNACYFLTGLDVPASADVRYVGDFKPTYFGFGKFKPGLKPADLAKP